MDMRTILRRLCWGHSAPGGVNGNSPAGTDRGAPACPLGTADTCTSCATATALQPVANRHPTGNEGASEVFRNGNEAASNSVTVRDDDSPSMTMTDSEVIG